MVARSSTPIKRGLIVANGVGVVDSDYCGPDDEVKIEVNGSATLRSVLDALEAKYPML